MNVDDKCGWFGNVSSIMKWLVRNTTEFRCKHNSYPQHFFGPMFSLLRLVSPFISHALCFQMIPGSFPIVRNYHEVY